MTCRVQTSPPPRALAPIRYHAPRFNVPGGYASCRECGTRFTLDQFLTESCPGLSGAVASGLPDPSDILCSGCQAPIPCDPMHRATLELFGTLCDACAARSGATAP
jgi:hypothetical protein